MDKQNHPHNIKIQNKNGFVVTRDGKKIIVGSRLKSTHQVVGDKWGVYDKIGSVSTRWCGKCKSFIKPTKSCCKNRMCDDILVDMKKALPKAANMLGVINMDFNPVYTSNWRFVHRKGYGHTVDYLMYAFL